MLHHLLKYVFDVRHCMFIPYGLLSHRSLIVARAQGCSLDIRLVSI